MQKVKVQKLSEEAFAPFGKVLTTKNRPYGGAEGVYKWYEKQAQIDNAETVSVNLLTAVKRDMICSHFEAHQKTEEVILPLTGDLIVAGIPAGEPLEDRLQAFLVPVGMGISWKPGSWHYAPYPVEKDATCAIIFRHGTGADDAVFSELKEIELEL
jgi:ureidoglycolate lyase